MNADPAPLNVPAELAAEVNKALRKDRAERYQTMEDLAADLRHLEGRSESVRELAPTKREPSPSGVAVMYFENLADRTDSDNLGAKLTGLLTTELSRSRGLEIPLP